VVAVPVKKKFFGLGAYAMRMHLMHYIRSKIVY